MQFGSVGLHFFFVLIGIVSRWSEISAVGVEVFLFTLIVVAVHGVFVLGMGKLLRLDIGTVAVASQAAVGGPTHRARGGHFARVAASGAAGGGGGAAGLRGGDVSGVRGGVCAAVSATIK